MPEAFILAGPNGAGKTTASATLIPSGIDFLNPDLAAAELRAGGHPDAGIGIGAGRVVLQRLHAAVTEQRSFCLETNLAGRGMIRPITAWRAAGYSVRLLFIALDSSDLAVRRVAERVASGGHDVPEATIRRRYASGLRALFAVYLDLVDEWVIADNSGRQPIRVASGGRRRLTQVDDADRWASLRHGQ